MSGDRDEWPDIQWPGPADEPDHERSDPHRPPLDDDEDGQWLGADDPRRLEAERRRGRPFDRPGRI